MIVSSSNAGDVHVFVSAFMMYRGDMMNEIPFCSGLEVKGKTWIAGVTLRRKYVTLTRRSERDKSDL